ncbi:hypothetical protein [Gordonia malaquae]|uniref:hypothetical protein n=1 Tax=Gordonia malaquae TaxID=410332 RepID=UPI0030FF2D0E
MTKTPSSEEITDSEKVGYLKERVYVAFTGLAIVVALYTGDVHHRTPGQSFATLMLGVLGVTSAAFASDVITHLAVHKHFPDVRTLGVIARTTLGALSSLVLPALLILAAAWDAIEIETALLVAGGIYVAELALIVWLSVRSAAISWQQRAAAMLILVGIGVAVLAIQVLAHA